MNIVPDAAVCDNCNQPMRLEKHLGTKQNLRKKKFRVRRYWCDLCQIRKTLFANGARDEAEANEAIDTIEEQFKQEQDARRK